MDQGEVVFSAGFCSCSYAATAVCPLLSSDALPYSACAYHRCLDIGEGGGDGGGGSNLKYRACVLIIYQDQYRKQYRKHSNNYTSALCVNVDLRVSVEVSSHTQAQKRHECAMLNVHASKGSCIRGNRRSSITSGCMYVGATCHST